MMEIYDVVTKLVGAIHPVGETTEDEKRFENLKVMTALVDNLIMDIDSIGMEKSRQEFSRKRAGEFADAFLTQLGIVE